MRIISILMFAILAGCAAPKVSVIYKPDSFGVPTPIIDGKPYPMRDDERWVIGRKFIAEYCS